MTSSTNSLPFNPFVYEGEEVDPEHTLRLPFLDVAFTADGLERMANEMDWAPIELQALRDAAVMVRWSAETTGISESDVIRHRLNKSGGLTLILREVVDNKEK